jgi:hypothetical protein
MTARLFLKGQAALGRVANYMGLGSRSVVLRALPKGGRGAEIGVWRGDFSAQLLSRTKPSHLALIDPWRFRQDRPSAWYGGGQTNSQADMDTIASSVTHRFAREIAAGRVTTMRMESMAAAHDIPDGSLDWVYIDGDHTFEGVRGDLGAFAPKVRSGGFIAGDDYGSPGWWEDGVTRAVMDFVRRSDTVVLTVHKGQFILQVPTGR